MISVMHIHMFILAQIFLLYRLLHNIAKSSSCYTVGPCLSILYIGVLSPACSVAQSCPTFCNSIDGSLPGSSVHEIL